MILADKIIALRKKAGWSQEELAQQLNVSRQSVSKWEGAQSVPDLKRILQMSYLFGVSTDYLLKDELEVPDISLLPDSGDNPLRRVTMEEASAYLDLSWRNAPWLALGVALCIFSPIVLLMPGGLSGAPGARLTENARRRHRDRDPAADGGRGGGDLHCLRRKNGTFSLFGKGTL